MALVTTETSIRPAAKLAAPWRLHALILLSLSYALSGKLSLMLAVAPGFASALFIPAGLAIAAVLISGYHTLPWIFLGSVLFSVWNGDVARGPINSTVIAAVLLMSVAATAQAAVGGALLRRALGRYIWMDHGKPIIRFGLLTPFICTISASLSVATLHGLGIIPREALLSSWCIWWIGDSLAVLIMVPLMLMLCGEPRKLWRRRLLTVGIPMMSGLLLFVIIFLRFSDWEKQQSFLEFDRLSQQVSDRIQTRFEGQEIFLQQAESFLSGGEDINQDSFKSRVGNIFTRYPAVMAVEWTPRVLASERKQYEAQHRVRIREKSADGKTLAIAPERDVYYPVTYIEPRQGNEEVLGFNLAGQRIPLSMLDAAASTGRTLISPPITLLQDRSASGIHHGLLVIYPVLSGAAGPGFVATVVRINQFMSDALPFLQGQLSVRLVDREAQVKLFDNFNVGAQPLFSANLYFGGRDYILQTTPTAEYLRAHRTWQSWAILVAGLLFTSLLAMALLLSTGHAARTEALVDVRTADLRDEKNFTEAVINGLPGIFYMLNGRGQLTHWNTNFANLIGIRDGVFTAGEVLKSILIEDRVAIQDAFHRVHATRGYKELEVRHVGVDGSIHHYLLNGQYIEIAGQPYMFGTGLDMTEMHNAKTRLQSANTELKKRVEEVRALQMLLQEQAIRDPLSGLYNRRYLDEMLERELAKAKREGYCVSVVMGDIDHFKDLNDSHGHQAGDEVIRMLATLLRGQARASDILCRFGGEEFLFALPGLNIDGAYERVDQWRALFAKQSISFGKSKISSTISFGIATYPIHGKTGNQLIAVADEALYIAKAKGRNRVEYFET